MDQRFRNHPRKRQGKADKKVKTIEGKEHKKYEFGSKVIITTTKTTGVIIGAINIEKNMHEKHCSQP